MAITILVVDVVSSIKEYTLVVLEWTSAEWYNESVLSS